MADSSSSRRLVSSVAVAWSVTVQLAAFCLFYLLCLAQFRGELSSWAEFKASLTSPAWLFPAIVGGSVAIRDWGADFDGRDESVPIYSSAITINYASLFLVSAITYEAFRTPLALLAGVPVFMLARRLNQVRYVSWKPTVRGSALVEVEEVQRLASQQPAQHRISWGGAAVPWEALDPHFCVMGITSGGKGLMIRMLMGSVLGSDGPAKRALIYDQKYDALPILHSLGVPPPQVFNLHPFDVRSVSWNIAEDITDEASASQMASILAPLDRNAANPYFAATAQDLIRAVIVALHERAPGNWVLNDVTESVATRERLKETLSKTQEGRELFRAHLEQAPETASNVFATIRTKWGPYAIVGRAWLKAKRSLSIHSWLTSSSIIVLGTDVAKASSIDPINRAFFKRLSDLIVTSPETLGGNETWLFLDEVRSAGRLDGLQELLTKGRSKGARAVLGFQNIHGLYDVYGQYAADELVGQCGNQAFLRVTDPSTMEWASRCFGQFEYFKETHGWSSSNQGESVSVSRTLEKREAVLPAEFRDLPQTNEHNGLTGFFATPSFGAWAATLPWSFVMMHAREFGGRAGHLPRGPSDQRRIPWTAADLRRLGLDEGGGEPPIVRSLTR